MTVLTLCALALLAAPTFSELRADLDGDGRPEAVRFYGGADARRGFLQLDDAEPNPTSEVFTAWKALAGRLAGEDQDAIVLGVWTTKRTRAGEPPRRTIWVVGREGGRWVERWRGSMLARKFDDFALLDLDGDRVHELVARECNGEQQGFTAYRWTGFGFAGAGRLALPCNEQPVPWNQLRLGGGRLWLD